MNEKQRSKIENAADVILNGRSKKNPFMVYSDAMDILKDYISTYDQLKNPKSKKNTEKIDFNVTEDTGTLINVLRLIVSSRKLKK